jgi:hypothetical protein
MCLSLAVTAIVMTGCATQPPSGEVPRSATQAYVHGQAPVPAPSELGTLPTPAPTRVERPNPALTKELVLARWLEAVAQADPVVYHSPAPGSSGPGPAPERQSPAVIRSSSIEEKTVQWIKENRPLFGTADLSLDSTVWLAVIEGDIPNAALPNGQNMGGRARRVDAMFSVATGMMIGMLVY